jgi:hypothetical protein
MSYRNRGIGSAIRWGFGLGIGLALYRIVFGALTLATVGVWSWTGQIHPVARAIVRTILIAALVAGLALILADL